jgi:membrane protein
MFAAFKGFSFRGIYDTSWKDFFNALAKEVSRDTVFNGAAALGFYLMLAIFPAMIFLLSLLPYLPIPDLHRQIMGLLDQILPGEAATFFSGTVQEVVERKKDGLLSFGALLTLWAASSGMSAIMKQLNMTYDVEDRRGYVKRRAIATALTIGFGALVISALGLIILGGNLQAWLAENMAWSKPLLVIFEIARWLLVPVTICLALALVYYFGPDVEQEFRFITPGSVLGVILLIVASLGFRVYVENFGNYGATYGSIGAMVVLMLWLYITGLVILLGSELNALIEHFNPKGKDKGERSPGVPSERTHPGLGVPVRP